MAAVHAAKTSGRDFYNLNNVLFLEEVRIKLQKSKDKVVTRLKMLFTKNSTNSEITVK